MIKQALKTLWGYLHRGFSLKILSLVLAFIIWCYVVAGTNPIRSKDIDGVALSLTNTAELTAKNLTIDYALSEIPESVDVKIEANVESHKNINENSVRATVNLAEINSVGDITLNISATSTQSGVVVKSVSPARVTLRIDELATREVPVTAQLTGEAKAGYYVSTPVLSDRTVTLHGAKKRIEEVAKAVCKIPIDNLTENERASYPLTLYNAQNEEIEIDLLKGELPTVIADLTVLPSKTIALRTEDVMSAVTNVKAGYEVTSVVIEPSAVEIAATEEALAGIAALRVQPVNAEEADKSIMVEAELQVPEGIEYISRTSVEVLLQIEEIQTEKVYKNQKIELRNLDESLNAEIVDAKFSDVTIVGGKSIVDPIKASDVRLYVDLAKVTSAGTYTYKVEAEEIPGLSKHELTLATDEVTVKITRAK